MFHSIMIIEIIARKIVTIVTELATVVVKQIPVWTNAPVILIVNNVLPARQVLLVKPDLLGLRGLCRLHNVLQYYQEVLM